MDRLSEEERVTIQKVMDRAKTFDDEQERIMSQPIEGQLLKFTSMFKGGFQPRWFHLEPVQGSLTYFLTHEALKKKQARGTILLLGAVIAPSDEDSQTFAIHASSGEVVRLKAADAKERQLWVSRLRHSVERLANFRGRCATSPASMSSSMRAPPAVIPRDSSVTDRLIPSSAPSAKTASTADGVHTRETSPLRSVPSNSMIRGRRTLTAQTSVISVASALSTFSNNSSLAGVQQMYQLAQQQEQQLLQTLLRQQQRLMAEACLDIHTEPNILLLKATAQANLQVLLRCINLLHEYEHRLHTTIPSEPVTDVSLLDFSSLHAAMAPPSMRKTSVESNMTSPPTEMSDKTDEDRVNRMTDEHQMSAPAMPADSLAVLADDDDENDPLLDKDDLYEGQRQSRLMSESAKPERDAQRAAVLELCSGLKLGMDLTRVSLPVFVLEKRSLLEVFADLFLHAQLFFEIPNGKDACERMLAVVRHYVCSLHTAVQHDKVSKPYNPLLGETFHCELRSPLRAPTESAGTNDGILFVGEQLTHHPPVSAFHAASAGHGLELTAYLSPHSKFLGMNVGVDLVGQGQLYLSKHSEEYLFNFPSVYCRSILTNPWMEFTGRVRITCPQTGYVASITFLAKPSYGSDFNQLSAEVRPQVQSAPVCKLNGCWNGVLTTTYENGEKEAMDVSQLARGVKIVKPMRKQGKMESRRLWRKVTSALKLEEEAVAASHKKALEERQKQQILSREKEGKAHSPQYFQRVDDRWVFNQAH